jgi:GT2 family glycosyltransferase
MLVSILVPVYNAAPFLAECLDSALAQRGCDIEVIALDDGSSDGSASILDLYRPRVRATCQANAGVSATRNSLVQLASGDHLLFLDADDVLAPGSVAERLAELQQANAEVIYCDWCFYAADSRGVFSDGQEVHRPIEELSPDPVLPLFLDFWAPPGAWLLKRSAFERTGGFRRDLPVIQDARLILDLALAGASFARLPRLGLRYRVRHGESLSRRDPAAFACDRLLNAEQVEQILAERGRLRAPERRALAGAFDDAARTLGVSSAPLAQRALAGSRRQQRAGMRLAAFSRLAVAVQPVLGALHACRLSAALAGARRRARSPWAF